MTEMVTLTFDFETPPTADDIAALQGISVKHRLPEAGGGLFDQEEAIVGGGSRTRFGGMEVPKDLLDPVLDDLRAAGFVEA